MKRFVALCLLALPLASCSSDGPREATPVVTPGGCPQLAIIRDLSVYQHPAAADETNLVISARMGNLQPNCRTDEEGNAVSDPLAQTSFDVIAVRGQYTAGKRAAMPFSVSIIDANDQVIKKEIYEIPVVFNENSRELRLTIPVNPNVGLAGLDDPSKYQVLIGFQLSAEQLKANTDYFSQIGQPTPQE